ncbi:MAG: helix-turn-helix domain-containing protein [Alphaproteobacteria bacterium]
MDQSVRAPNPVDVHVGTRVRLRRTLLGMTQTGLGQAIGLTFQQVQKYERGVNRIGSSRLYDLARVLDVPVNFFFDEMPKEIASKSGAPSSGRPEGAEVFDPDIVSKRETLELVRAYYKIDNPQVRKRLFEMVKALGKST